MKKSDSSKRKIYNSCIAFIEDSKGNYLVQKTFQRKKGFWALPGGHVKSGQFSIEAIHEEMIEEMRIDVAIKDIELFKTYKYENAFKDVYIIHKDIDLSMIKLEDDEVEKVSYLSKKEIYDLIFKNGIRKTNIDAIEDVFNTN